MDLSFVYFPSAVVLGGLHALEPGHAKTLTASYLIGTKGTKSDAVLLGLSVAFTHSLVVVGLSAFAMLIGRTTFTDEASHYLAMGSGVVVTLLGCWLVVKRWRAMKRVKSRKKFHFHGFSSRSLGPVQSRAQAHHDHASMSDDEHARAHMADLPAYVFRGERPSPWQIMIFGAAGGLVPCPAAISVMLLGLSVDQVGAGFLMVLGFGLGLALTLVGIGLLIVMGISKLNHTGKLSRISAFSPLIAAVMVIVSGCFSLIMALR